MHVLRHAAVCRAACAIWRWGVLMAAIPLLAACAPAVARGATAPTSVPTASTQPAPGAASPASPVAIAGVSGPIVSMTYAMKFEPATLTIARGTTVTWHNSSQMVHTVTDDPAKASNKADAALPSGVQPWDSGNLNPGESFTHTFDVPGTYRYFCIPHELLGMTGTIVVTG